MQRTSASSLRRGRSVLFLICFVFFTWQISFAYADSCVYAGTGNWNINGTCLISNQRINLTGNLSLYSNATVTFSNVTLLMHIVTNGKYGIYAYNGSSFNITRSNITSLYSTSSCAGIPEPCANFFIEEECRDQWGCGWLLHSGPCQFTAIPCSGFSMQGNCTTQSGCSWITNSDYNYKFVAYNGSSFYMDKSSVNKPGYSNTLYQRGLGIYTNGATIKNSKISNSYYGLVLFSDNNIIVNNTVTGGAGKISTLYLSGSSDNTFANNTFNAQATTGGIYAIWMLQNCNNNYFINNTVKVASNAGYPIYISMGDNNTFSKNKLISQNLDYLIIFSQSSTNNLIKDCKLMGKSHNYITQSSSGTNTLLNTSMDSSTVSEGKLYVKWYVDAYVYDPFGAVPNAAVIGYDRNGIAQFTQYTAFNGWMARQNVTQYYQNNISRINYTNYTVRASKNNVVKNITTDRKSVV
jgi:hypothetical protein